MPTQRDLILDTTCTLLEAQGFHATGLNQILRESSAPKGSLYYYFPDGKDGLAAEAIQRTGALLAERIRAGLSAHADPAEALRQFVLKIANGVEASGFRAGGPLMTVALETAATNDRLNRVCREAYGGLQSAFAEKLQAGGFAPDQAMEWAIYINAAIEGGIILSRTRHSGDPLRIVAEHLGKAIRAALAE